MHPTLALERNMEDECCPVGHEFLANGTGPAGATAQVEFFRCQVVELRQNLPLLFIDGRPPVMHDSPRTNLAKNPLSRILC